MESVVSVGTANTEKAASKAPNNLKRLRLTSIAVKFIHLGIQISGEQQVISRNAPLIVY